ncbi:MAG: hypothetical protein R2824_21745 [Saprospiraceae bacterium]|nr:hypothetical protein [Lewinella sp.]
MFPFRFIGVAMFAVGLVLFAPFIFRFLIFAILIGAALRLMRRIHYARYGYEYGGCGRHHHRRFGHHPFGSHTRDRYEEDGIVPSDY